MPAVCSLLDCKDSVGSPLTSRPSCAGLRLKWPTPPSDNICLSVADRPSRTANGRSLAIETLQIQSVYILKISYLLSFPLFGSLNYMLWNRKGSTLTHKLLSPRTFPNQNVNQNSSLATSVPLSGGQIASMASPSAARPSIERRWTSGSTA